MSSTIIANNQSYHEPDMIATFPYQSTMLTKGTKNKKIKKSHKLESVTKRGRAKPLLKLL